MKQQMVYNFLLFLLMRSLVSTSHSSVVINLDAFLNSQLQLTTFHKESLSQSLIFKHSHLHLFLFHFCLLLQTFSSNKQSHLQVL